MCTEFRLIQICDPLCVDSDSYDDYVSYDYGDASAYIDFDPSLEEAAAAALDLSTCQQCDSRGR